MKGSEGKVTSLRILRVVILIFFGEFKIQLLSWQNTIFFCLDAENFCTYSVFGVGIVNIRQENVRVAKLSFIFSNSFALSLLTASEAAGGL